MSEQIYHIFYSPHKNPDSKQLVVYFTTDKAEVARYFNREANGMYEYFKVFAYPQGEEIKDAEVVLKKKK